VVDSSEMLPALIPTVSPNLRDPWSRAARDHQVYNFTLRLMRTSPWPCAWWVRHCSRCLRKDPPVPNKHWTSP